MTCRPQTLNVLLLSYHVFIVEQTTYSTYIVNVLFLRIAWQIIGQVLDALLRWLRSASSASHAVLFSCIQLDVEGRLPGKVTQAGWQQGSLDGG